MTAPAPASDRIHPPAGGGGGRAQRSVATWLTGVGATAVVSLVGFLATPLLVRWLGDTQWGAWTMIGEWLGYLGLTQMALGPGAITIFLLRAHTSSQPGALTAMAKRGFRIYSWAAVAIIPAALALAWWAPLALHTGPTLTRSLRWAVGIAALGSLALAPPLLFRSVLETVQRGYRVRAALLIQSLLITGLSLWWVAMRWGIVGMAAANFVGLCVGAGLWCWWARPWLPAWRTTRPAPLPASQLWRFHWPLMLALVGNQINMLTDNTVVGLAIAPAAVAAFALTQSLPLLAGAQLTDIGAASWAALGELRARGDSVFAHRIVELSATVLGLGLVLMSTLAAFNRPFVDLWVGTNHYDGALLTWATAASMVVFGLLCFFSWLLDTQGDTRRRLAVSAAGAVLNLGLSLVLVRRWGAGGVAMGTLVAYLCTDAWFLPHIAVRHYGVPGPDLVRALLGALGRGGVWALLMVGISLGVTPARSWPGLAGELALAGVAALAYGWTVVLRPADRAAWQSRWRGLLPSR